MDVAILDGAGEVLNDVEGSIFDAREVENDLEELESVASFPLAEGLVVELEGMGDENAGPKWLRLAGEVSETTPQTFIPIINSL